MTMRPWQQQPRSNINGVPLPLKHVNSGGQWAVAVISTTMDTVVCCPPSAVHRFNSILAVVFMALCCLASPLPPSSNAVVNHHHLQTPSSISTVEIAASLSHTTALMLSIADAIERLCRHQTPLPTASVEIHIRLPLPPSNAVASHQSLAMVHCCVRQTPVPLPLQAIAAFIERHLTPPPP